MVVNWCASTKFNFILWNKVGNFRGFQVFDFDPYTEMENSENSEIFSTLLNLSEFLLFEKVGNFRGFRVFDFGPYTEIENSENSEISSRFVIVLLEEVGNFWVFRVFDFGLYVEIENSENPEFFSRLVKLSEFVLFKGSYKFSRLLKGRFCALKDRRSNK